MPEQDSRLPPRAEALLGTFRIPEHDFDALSARIEAKVRETAIGSTDGALLEAPFPNEPGEDAAPADAASPRLSDLARAVAQKRSGAADADLARETLNVASKLRSQTDVLIERMRQAPRAVEPPLRPESSGQAEPARSVRRVESKPAVQAVAAPPRPSTPKPANDAASRRAIWFGGAGLSLAAAAMLVLFLRTPAPELSRSAAEPPPPAAAATPKSAPAEELAVATPPVVAQSPRGVIAQEPPAATVTAPPDSAPGSDAAPVAVARRASSGPPSADKPKASKKAGETVVLEEESGAPAPAQQAAAPPAEAALKPAAGKADGMLPDKPSTGAVQAALASVMNAARACVAGSPDTTPVTVVFASDGSVKSVAVGGAAQGTPAGKCIQAAFSRAKVGPFAQSAFSVGVSVRQ